MSENVNPVKATAPVAEYINGKENLFKYFNCEGNYYVKTLLENKWVVKGDDDFYFLSYFDKNDNKKDAVVVRKNDKPLIYKTDDFTMIIAIDCVKIAFIFKNSNKI